MPAQFFTEHRQHFRLLGEAEQLVAYVGESSRLVLEVTEELVGGLVIIEAGGIQPAHVKGEKTGIALGMPETGQHCLAIFGQITGKQTAQHQALGGGVAGKTIQNRLPGRQGIGRPPQGQVGFTHFHVSLDIIGVAQQVRLQHCQQFQVLSAGS